MTAELAPEITFHLVNTLGWPGLRPLQSAAVAPLRAGRSALLVAPTAGGKTEAAILPVLSQMSAEGWWGLSVIYVTPLRALLNNLHPRLESYAAWVGRRVGLWHGDVGAGERRRILDDPPDVLLTTPESLEAMLVSSRVDHGYFFSGVRAVVVDELHAFAGDDRGWHLLAVLERLERVAEAARSSSAPPHCSAPGDSSAPPDSSAPSRFQRIGMTATVGNPRDMLAWLTRSADLPGADPGVVVAPEVPSATAGPAATAGPSGAASSGTTAGAVSSTADIVVDYVATTANAAKVIDLLHPGEKRLVFCQSRAQAERLAAELRERRVPTVVSHSSLSADERRHAERTFAEAPECVVVATSTLELGVDIGDLDRVIQLDAPTSVASFLQRLGRTGRRPGSRRNMTFLATGDNGLLQSVALLRLWGAGYVEPVVPPPCPQHIAAQQLLALGLQEGRYPLAGWREWWPGLAWMQEARPILEHLLTRGFLSFDAGFAVVGDESERRFGRRNFIELTSVFTAAPELRVVHGRAEVGAVSPLAVTGEVPGGRPRVLSLGGRSWLVTHIDWRRRQVFVTPDRGRGRSVWQGGPTVMSAELAESVRQVLLGGGPGDEDGVGGVHLSKRAVAQLGSIRAESQGVADASATTVQVLARGFRWWTWAGTRANVSLAAALEEQGWEATARGLSVDVRDGESVRLADLRKCAELLRRDPPVGPSVDQRALGGLKFAEVLPPEVAALELAMRMADAERGAEVASGPVVWCRSSG